MKLWHRKFLRYLCGVSIIATTANGTTLMISNGKVSNSFSTSDLLKRNDLETIVVKKDPAYFGKQMSYRAVKAASLFEGIEIAEFDVVQYKASDGFSGIIPKERLLNRSKSLSQAYIAIENPQKKWPFLKNGKATPGPFYLIWKNPLLSNISTEEWPYMLVSLVVNGSLKKLFPKIFPSPKLNAKHDVLQGFKHFIKHCFPCHTINKNGNATMGPDLNYPRSPTEYLKKKYLEALIRNPQSIRSWPKAKMKGFSKDQISDLELEQIIEYLNHMAESRND